jgi:ABC-type oligopeptide transport system substrate-binding subunit
MVTAPPPRRHGLSGVLYSLLGFSCLALSLVPVAFTDPPAPSTPVTGDWLIEHLLSDPEQLNPLTSDDKSSNDILGNIPEGLPQWDPRTLAWPTHARGEGSIVQWETTAAFRRLRFSIQKQSKSARGAGGLRMWELPA